MKPQAKDCARVMEVVEGNIELLHQHEERKRGNRSASQKLADKITASVGTMASAVVHAVIFSFWILANVGALGLRPFDPFPFGLLTMMLSIEAIFLTLFVLISQNRMQQDSDARAELDVQINLLTEHELTRLIRMVDRIGDKLGVQKPKDPELKAMEADIDPEIVIQQIEDRKEKSES
jgi:uncharacterized membrane protein